MESCSASSSVTRGLGSTLPSKSQVQFSLGARAPQPGDGVFLIGVVGSCGFSSDQSVSSGGRDAVATHTQIPDAGGGVRSSGTPRSEHALLPVGNLAALLRDGAGCWADPTVPPGLLWAR